MMATGGRDADLLGGVRVEDGGVDLCRLAEPDILGSFIEEFPFGVLVVVLAGIGDVLSADEDVAVICREKDRGWVG